MVAELQAAEVADHADQPQVGFRHLERAHVLGQASTVQHVRVHVRMLLWVLKRKCRREVVAQVVRIVGSATKTAIGWTPLRTPVAPTSVRSKSSHSLNICLMRFSPFAVGACWMSLSTRLHEVSPECRYWTKAASWLGVVVNPGLRNVRHLDSAGLRCGSFRLIAVVRRIDYERLLMSGF